MSTASYGSWTSPVTLDLMTSSSTGLSAPSVDGPDLYWVESRADQGGRSSLWRDSEDGRVELTPEPFYVRTRVHEYGGGEYAATQRTAVVSSFGDGRLHRIDDRSGPTPITPAADLRFADLRLHPERDLVLAVREDHRGPGEAVNTVVALSLTGPNDDGGTVLCSGADFYASPELSADGRLAWTEWNHPNMPWDSTTIRVGRLTPDAVVEVTTVAGGPGESAVHPRWTPSGRLVFISDRTNWWNLYAWSDGETRALRESEAEFTQPPWQLGQNPYAVIDDDTVLCTWSRNGASALGRLTLSSGELTTVSDLGVGTSTVSVSGGRAAAVLTREDAPPALTLLDLTTSVWTVVKTSSDVAIDPAMISVAQPVSWSSPQGPVYGWFYPPRHAALRGPDDERPPLITISHGGPTAFSPATFSLSVQYWTTRGVAVLDVNYGGSTGYGRAYRERLQGRWGLVDVEDCAAGAVAMGEQGLVDPARLAIKGGSAGGYTTLRALTSTDVFSAGISLYGVGDLEALATDTHKFESRYLDGLVGPYPEAIETYTDRSPIHHVDQLSSPILLLQGSEDKVVPPNQAEMMADAARAKGLPVALLIFAGEGHGFRRAENIQASLAAQLYFLGRVFGFDPADELDPIEIENLPA